MIFGIIQTRHQIRKAFMERLCHTGIKSVKSGKNIGSLVVTADWLDKDGKIMLKETTTYNFQGTDNQRIMDRITTLTAADKEVLFKDVKDGMFAIRLARQLEHPSTKAEIFTDAKWCGYESSVVR